jgi:hypothetical protein
MERALALDRIRAALAGASRLPTLEQLVRLLADLEVELFLRNPQFPRELLNAGWYLHGIAQAERFEEFYPRERRLAAWQVALSLAETTPSSRRAVWLRCRAGE